MCMLSEGGRYDSQIALLFLNAGRGSASLMLAPTPLSLSVITFFRPLEKIVCGDRNC